MFNLVLLFNGWMIFCKWNIIVFFILGLKVIRYKYIFVFYCLKLNINMVNRYKDGMMISLNYLVC